jgi:hypothetical protein
MASFRIIFPFLLRSNGNDLELNTVSGVSAQARLIPTYVAEMPQLEVARTSSETPHRRAANELARPWFHGFRKKADGRLGCDIYAAAAATNAFAAA